MYTLEREISALKKLIFFSLRGNKLFDLKFLAHDDFKWAQTANLRYYVEANSAVLTKFVKSISL